MRAVSTVLDASLCLLFVTASALTLVGTPLADQSSSDRAPDAIPETADETVEILTTTTASVTYEVGDRNRTAHDTLAGLLASAALEDADSASAMAFRSAVTERVVRTLRFADVEVQVFADATPESDSTPDSDWTLDPDSARNGPLVAGPSPPRDEDVHAATVRVRGVQLTVRTWSR